MREELHSENGAQGWLEPTEVLQGFLGALLSGSDSVPALQHTLRSFLSVASCLLPAQLSDWN